MKTKIFFDTEFTGLHQKTTLVSIGLVAETGETFYAELNDYDASQVDQWLKDNVIAKLQLSNGRAGIRRFNEHTKETTYFGETKYLASHLKEWLSQFESVEMWSDCLSYDWVLFNNIFGHAFNIPNNVYYIPFDICTLFYAKGIDPDISREKYAYDEVYSEMIEKKHTALWDAQVIKVCFEKLTS